MEENLDLNLCRQFLNEARKTQAWFKFINPFTNKPLTKGSATYNKLLKKCKQVDFGAFIVERKKKSSSNSTPTPSSSGTRSYSRSRSPSSSSRSKSRSSGSSMDLLTKEFSKLKVSPIRSPMISPSPSRKISISSPEISPEEDFGPELTLKLSKTPSPLRSPLISNGSFDSQKTVSISPRRMRSRSPLPRSPLPRSPSPKPTSKKLSSSPRSLSPSPKPSLPSPHPVKKIKKVVSPKITYPVIVPSKSIPTIKKETLLDFNKCNILLEEAENLQEGEKMKNPFTNKMIIKGKSTFLKLVKDCQKYVREYKDEHPKVDEFDLEDILSLKY
jgi:hypothetical protein